MGSRTVRLAAQAGGGDVKWFQCDSNTPNKPGIKHIIRAGLDPPNAQQAAAGALLLLWCYIAAYGEQEPGVGVRADGSPLNLLEMADECHFRDTGGLTRFLGECAERDHIDKDAWRGKGIVVLPEMRSRADTYTKRISSNKGAESSNTSSTTSKSGVLFCTVPSGSDVLDRSVPRETGPVGLPLEGEDQVDALITIWNEEADRSLPRVRRPNPTRRAVFGRALKAHPDLSKWRMVIRHLNRSQWWLHGGKDHPNWRGDLDYLCEASGSKFERQLARAEADKGAASGPQRGERVDAKRGRVIPIPGKYGGANGTEN